MSLQANAVLFVSVIDRSVAMMIRFRVDFLGTARKSALMFLGAGIAQPIHGMTGAMTVSATTPGTSFAL